MLVQGFSGFYVRGAFAVPLRSCVPSGGFLYSIIRVIIIVMATISDDYGVGGGSSVARRYAYVWFQVYLRNSGSNILLSC